MQEYISIEPLYRFAVQLMKSSTFCALAIVDIYAIYAGLCGGSLTVQADGALQGTGPL